MLSHAVRADSGGWSHHGLQKVLKESGFVKVKIEYVKEINNIFIACDVSLSFDVRLHFLLIVQAYSSPVAQPILLVTQHILCNMRLMLNSAPLS